MAEPTSRPTWDEYFLAIVEVVSTRSPDPHTKHGCVLVDAGKRVLSTGYNGPVSGLPRDLSSLSARTSTTGSSTRRTTRWPLPGAICVGRRRT